LAEHATPSGIRYAELRFSRAYATVVRLAGELIAFDPATLTTDLERIAFWVNVYNALVIHAVTAHDIRRGVVEDRGRAYYRQVGYLVGGQHMSPHAIENGILRRNRPSGLQPAIPFGADDPRLAWMVDTVDPRIHFAVVCGARSCPVVRAFEPARLDAQLDNATRTYLADMVTVDTIRGVLRLPQLFQWYAEDFGRNRAAILAFVRRHVDTPVDGRLAIEYAPYDWSLNDAPERSD